MPSGAKKRKAARKKKEQQNNINPSTSIPEGDDELKSQDGKGSDGGESNSPAHHEHGDHDHPFNDGSEEVEEGGDPSAAQEFASSDVNSVEEVSGDVKIERVLVEKEDSVVVIERDLQSEESSERRNESFEHGETAKESYYENGNTGDFSNGESLAEEKSKDDDNHSFEEAIASQELVKSSDSSPTELISTTESALIEEPGDSAAEYSDNSAKAVASVSEVENGDAGSRSVSLEKSVVPPIEVTDLAMKVNEDNAYPLTDENAATSSLEEPKPKENDSKVLPLSSASPSTEFTNGTKHIKNSETPEFSENQPRVTSAPNMVQKTSWLSCCGLFEVLSGSNR